MTGITVPDAIGALGAAAIVAAYFLLQLGRIKPDSPAFSAANAAGAAAIIFSLVYSFNLSAMIIEVFWLVISLFGLLRAVRLRRNKSGSPQAQHNKQS